MHFLDTAPHEGMLTQATAVAIFVVSGAETKPLNATKGVDTSKIALTAEVLSAGLMSHRNRFLKASPQLQGRRSG